MYMQLFACLFLVCSLTFFICYVKYGERENISSDKGPFDQVGTGCMNTSKV